MLSVEKHVPCSEAQCTLLECTSTYNDNETGLIVRICAELNLEIGTWAWDHFIFLILCIFVCLCPNFTSTIHSISI